MILPRQVARLLSLLTMLVVAGCAGLSNEPQIVSTIPPPTQAPPTPADLGHPATPPDLANGARIYAARCTSCHGATGAGDGELVTSGQLAVDGEVIQPASFRDPAAARTQSPEAWFSTITNGRIERLMPPWANALTEQERWDVAYYTYTMHYTREQLTRGLEIWEIECVDCHGVEGRGDGPEAADARKRVDDLTDQYELSIVSDTVLYNYINEGSADAMPAYGEELTEEQLWDVAAFSRTLSLANTDVIGQTIVAQEPTPAPTLPASTSGTITGSLSNGTADGTIPSETTVTLFVVDADLNTQRFETTSDTEGSFTFSDVPIDAALSYAATVTYRERPFASEVITGGTDGMQLPITIYELTEDPSVISVTGIVYQVNAVGDGLQVAQVMLFQNTSDRTFTSGRTVGENQYASVFITLPPGAALLSDSQGRYVVSEDGSTVIDTVPIAPARDHVVQIIYLLPYEGSAIIEQPVNYPVNGAVRLLLRPDSVRASSAQLPALGPEDISGVTYSSYGADLVLNAGEVVRFELNGTGVSSAAQLEPQAVTANNLPIIIALGVVGVLILVGVVYTLNRRTALAAQPAQNKQQIMDALLRQIAELDEAEARGEINHDLYHHQRKQLKARLAALMEED